MIIDTHAHLYDEKFTDKDKLIKELTTNNVEAVINAGCDLETCKKCLELSSKYENVYSCLGVHPESAEEFTEEVYNYIDSHLDDEKVVGVGEIGLDYHFVTGNKEIQKQAFIRQIKLANKHKLPVVIHLRDAYGDAMEIFKEYKDYLVNGVTLHCFSGSKEYYEEIKKLGFYISFGGSVTFKNNYKGVSVAGVVEKDKFLLETDCPYLAPVPVRGTINEPKNIKYVASFLANIFYKSPEEIIDMATINTKTLFKKIK